MPNDRLLKGRALHDAMTGVPDTWWTLEEEDQEDWAQTAESYEEHLALYRAGGDVALPGEASS